MNSKGALSLEDLNWKTLEEAVEQFIMADGPNTNDLPATEFFSLWEQFDAERRSRVIEVEGELIGEDVSLSLASSNVRGTEVNGREIRLPDGTRIVLRFKLPQLT